MKKICTKILSLVLAGIMLFTSNGFAAALTGEADSFDKEALADMKMEDVAIESNTSVGKLLADDLADEVAEQKDNDGYVITGAEVAGKDVLVEYQTAEDATVIVAIYDEKGEQLIASGNADALASQEKVVVAIDTDAMPDYFFLRVFLVDKESKGSLCTGYDSPMYTKDMKDLLNSSIDDYESEGYQVLNFDKKEDNNFAVYNKNVSVIENVDGVNDISSIDEDANKYVIRNIDDTVRSLQNGDIISIQQQNGEVLIICVKTVTVNDDDSAVIVGQDTSMEDVFDYVKIDTSLDSGEAEIDSSTCGEGVGYKGIIDGTQSDSEEDEQVQRARGWALEDDMTDTKSVVHEFSNKNFSGSTELNLKSSLKYYISVHKQYLEVKLDYKQKFKLKIENKLDVNVPLSEMRFSFVAGVSLVVVPRFILNASVTVELNGKITGQVGFEVSSGKIKDISKKPKLDAELKIEGYVTLGISLEPKINIVDDCIVYAKLKATATSTIEAKYSSKVPANQKHNCDMCFDGDITADINLKCEAKLLNTDLLYYKLGPFDKKMKIADFYYSVDHKEFALGTCPHISYKVTVFVTDSEGSPAQGAAVKCGDVKGETNQKGKCNIYLVNGKHTITVSKEGLKTEKEKVTVKSKSKKCDVQLKKENSGGGNDEGDVGEDDIALDLKVCHQTFVHSDLFSAAITDDGKLYTWGDNISGILGDGTTEDKNIPTFIMDNVASISLGYGCMAAITEDRKLYTWGFNLYGQLGNGSSEEDAHVPTYIMDKVVYVDFVLSNTAVALTEDGKLYKWGRNTNFAGRELTPCYVMDGVVSVTTARGYITVLTADGKLYTLGDETLISGEKPTLVMEDVVAVKGAEHNVAAITADGKLYTWGKNDCGQLGDGTTEDKTMPTYVMDNVLSVSFGDKCESMAAITADNKLYTWGRNNCGQLGDGTTEEKTTPTYIMDGVKSIGIIDNDPFNEAYTAIVTTDSKLYMCGKSYDMLGESTYDKKTIPFLLLDNADTFYQKYDFMSVITKDGQLYTWGYDCGQADEDGGPRYETSPTHLMDNVFYACRGTVLTDDGNLYLWGDNTEGSLGDGTYESKYVPTHIMSDVMLPSTKTYKINPISSMSVLAKDEKQDFVNESVQQMKAADFETETGYDSYTDLQADTLYMYYIVKENDGEKLLSPNNLLYVAQGLSDSNGDLSFDYHLREEFEGAVAVLVEPPIEDEEYIDDEIESEQPTVGEEFDLEHYNIQDVSTEGKTVKVKYKTDKDAIMLVAIYDKEGEQLLSSGEVKAAALSDEVTVMVDMKTVPADYYIRTFLVDEKTKGALCPVQSKHVISDGSESDGTQGNTDEISDNIRSESRTMSSGGYHFAYISTDGKLYTWGNNLCGQLGDATDTDRFSFYKVKEDVAAVSCGLRHTAAVTREGKLYTWGDNYCGQLGNGTTVENKSPVSLVMEDVVSVNCGLHNTGAVTADGKLYMWGDNSCGQLGDGTTEDKTEPVYVMDNVKAISCGSYHTAAITADGKLYTWGRNEDGELGDGTTENKMVPVFVMDDVVNVSCFGSFTATVTSEGKLYTWGENVFGQLGDGTTENKSEPTYIMDDIVTVACGTEHMAAVKSDGKLYTWGYNLYGQIGDGKGENKTTPVYIMDNVAAVSLGCRHTAVVTSDGKLYAWGDIFGHDCSLEVPEEDCTPNLVASNVMLPSAGSKPTVPGDASEQEGTDTNTALKGRKSYKDLKPNTTYMYYMVKSKTVEDILEADNLLYVAQKVSDSGGNVVFNYYMREKYDGALSILAEPSLDNNHEENPKEEDPKGDDPKEENPGSGGADPAAASQPAVLADLKLSKIKTQYYVRDVLDVDDITIIAVYSDGSEKQIDRSVCNVRIMDAKFNKVDDKIIFIKACNPYLLAEYEENGISKQAKLYLQVLEKTQATTEQTKKVTKPSKVSSLKVKAKGSGKISITWKKAKNAYGYQVQIAKNKKFSKGKKSKTTYDKFLIWKKLKKKQVYYVRVRAYNYDGFNKLYGSWSGAKKIKVK